MDDMRTAIAETESGEGDCLLLWILVWSELAAAMPGAGGTYHYLKQGFAGTRLGRLLPFLFIWQFICSGPLEIASGLIGFAQYVGYFWHGMGVWETRAVVIAAGAAVIALLYRRTGDVGKLTVVLWIGMLATVIWMIASGIFRFDSKIAFDFPPGAFEFSRGFALGLGSAMLIAMYDFLGYYDICYIGAEVKEPARTIPRAILYSTIAVALIYAVMNLSIIGVIPWREAMVSKYIAADFMDRIYGGWAGSLITLMILWTAMASVFALLLGYSRIPFAAAQDGYFFSVFGKLHPTQQFPYVSLLVVGGLSILAGMMSLDWVISALITARILVQFLGQIAVLFWIRRNRPDIALPFRMPLYPLPALIAIAGWLYVFGTAGLTFILYGLGTIAVGVVLFLVWERRRTTA